MDVTFDGSLAHTAHHRRTHHNTVPAYMPAAVHIRLYFHPYLGASPALLSFFYKIENRAIQKSRYCRKKKGSCRIMEPGDHPYQGHCSGGNPPTSGRGAAHRMRNNRTGPPVQDSCIFFSFATASSAAFFTSLRSSSRRWVRGSIAFGSPSSPRAQAVWAQTS